MSGLEQQGQWRVKVPAGEFGPVDFETLRAWVQQGRVTPRDFVLSPETNAWVPAANVPQFAGLFRPSTGQGLPLAAPPQKKGWGVGCLIGGAVAAFIVLVLLVLAGMLLPALGRAREAARRVMCLGNLSQQGVALEAYMEDHQGACPWKEGTTDPNEAWRDLGMLYPEYVSGWECFACPSSDDQPFNPKASGGGMLKDNPSGTLAGGNTREVISYSYGYARPRQGPRRPWRMGDPSTVRLMADKKAAYLIGHPKNLEDKVSHNGHGRNVLYLDWHVKWTPGPMALDPDEDDDRIGKPDAKDYSDWWADPPFYGE